jgi:hypothetical protein
MAKHLFALAAIALVASGPVVAAQTPAKSAQAQTQGAPAHVTGAWQVSMQGQGTAVMQTLAITQKGSAINGTLKAPQGNAVEFHGTITGNQIAFTVKRPTPDGDVTQNFAGTVSGDSIDGTVTQGQYHVGWKAARLKQQALSTSH